MSTSWVSDYLLTGVYFSIVKKGHLNNLFLVILGRNIGAREAGSNKQTASKSCALSLVRQLFHLGVIEAFSGTLKKNKEVEDLPPYDVELPPEIVTQIGDSIKAMEYYPVDTSNLAASGKYYQLIFLERIVYVFL